MRIVMTSLAVLALMACNKPADTTTENIAEENMAMESNAMDANAMATPAGFQINETSWEFTREGKATTESIDAAGNYVAWSGSEHVDHGTAVMKDDKACFTSAMDKEGEVCWTTQPTEIGQSMETTSDKGEKLTVKRVAYMAVPDNVKP
jgi:predicted transcriptional regulator